MRDKCKAQRLWSSDHSFSEFSKMIWLIQNYKMKADCEYPIDMFDEIREHTGR